MKSRFFDAIDSSESKAETILKLLYSGKTLQIMGKSLCDIFTKNWKIASVISHKQLTDFCPNLSTRIKYDQNGQQASSFCHFIVFDKFFSHTMEQALNTFYSSPSGLNICTCGVWLLLQLVALASSFYDTTFHPLSSASTVSRHSGLHKTFGKMNFSSTSILETSVSDFLTTWPAHLNLPSIS